MLRQQAFQQPDRFVHPALISERHRQIEERIRVRRIPFEGHAQHPDSLFVIARHQEIDTPFRKRLRFGGITPADDDAVCGHHDLGTTALTCELICEMLAYRLAEGIARKRALRFRQLIAVEFVQRQLDLVGCVLHQINVWGAK